MSERKCLPIILLNDSGEFGNRVVAYCHLLAWSQAFQVPVVNSCFWRYRLYFSKSPGLLVRPGDGPRSFGGRPLSLHRDRCFWCRVPFIGGAHKKFIFDGSLLWRSRIVFERVLGYVLRFVFRLKMTRWALSRCYKVTAMNIGGHVLELAIPRWLASEALATVDLSECVEKLRAYWEIRPEYLRMAEGVKRCMGKDAFMLGVHVRRGDYAVYRNGKWLMTDGQYCRWVEKMTCFGNRNTSVVFVSNGSLENLLKEFPGSTSGPGHFIGDLCALGMCDLISGPPSTFSGTASFLFDKPVAWMDDEDQARHSGHSWVPQWY